MRVISLFVSLALFAGCSSAPKKDAKDPKAAEAKPAPASRKQVKAQGSTAATPSPAPSSKQTFHPMQAMFGRVSAVREDLQFVVIDFGNNKLPPLEQRLNVYRLDQKVAEIKVTGPYLGTTVVADIMKGEVKFGDIVKPD